MEIPINKIICGDNVAVLSKFPNDCIDLTVTSPPYDNLRNYKGYSFDFEILAKELYRVTKPGGIVVWVVGDATIDGSETGTSYKQALYFKEIGFNLHDTMIYEKNSSTFPANKKSKRYSQIFEYMFVFSKDELKTFNLIIDKENKWAGYKDFSGILKNPVPKYSPRINIWIYTTSFNTKTNHPAIFPEKLARDHIISWSNEGDIVLDPMCGSGTTLVEAKKLNRRYIGIDISKEYCEISRKRVIIDREHFEAVELGEKLNSEDFKDLMI